MPKDLSQEASKNEERSRQLRADFYEREKSPKRVEVNERLHELGVKLGAHNPPQEEEETTTA